MNKKQNHNISSTYGINGSLRKKEVTQPQQNTEYYLFNSQGNLKAYSDDIMDFAYYGYNAANTRTYKLSLYNTNIWINGQQEPLNMQLQQAMFYPNTYLNFNGNGEYTKHYYNGTERIASRLGDNTTTIALNNNILEGRKLQAEDRFKEDIHKLIYETVPIDMPPFIDVNALQPTDTPNDIYYYHPNHLGNTAFVTDQNQNITQGFLYAPFGEITTEYNINFGNNTIPKYSFNAKELDEETGMYYYEARYYKPPVFTSRDAMFEKYFWMSPYAYCANNPVKYVDPSGKEKIPWLNTKKQENNNLLQGVKCYKDNIPNIINIFAHGNNDVGWKNGFIRENGGEWYNVSSFEKMLAGQSTIWKNKNIDDKITIIFHVCNLDLDDNNSKSPSLSFAKRLSASPEFQNVVVVASEGGVEYGVKITKKDGKPINTSFIESSESNWNVYYKGKLIGTYDKENSMEGKNPREDFKQQIEELDKMQ